MGDGDTAKIVNLPAASFFSHAFNESDKRRNEPNFAILSLCFNKCGTKEKDKACVAEKKQD